MNRATRLLAACRRQPVDATPVWFMRQAGRCLPEYRALRERYDMLTLTQTPDLCAEVTLMPVRRFGVDGAVLYADIMTPFTGMGVGFDIRPEVGPIVHEPIRTSADVDRLRVVAGEEAAPATMAALRLLRRELAGGQAALIGFAGAPFTLASYLVEGRPSRDYARTKALMYSEPDTWRALMDKLSEVVIRYLVAQADAGAQVLQLFDSWAGALAPWDYQEYVQPHVARIFAALRQAGTPSIYFGTATSELLPSMAMVGADVIGLDWRVPLDAAWQRVGPQHAVQGNLDPTLLLAPWARLERGVSDVLRRAGGRPGHIFNLGHGVLPQTPPEQLARLALAVHQATERPAVEMAGGLAQPVPV